MTATNRPAPAPMIVRPEAAPAWRQLGAVLTNLTDAGERVPCIVAPLPFVSDEPEERRAAVAWCSGCLAVVACARFAEDNREPFGVWGGRDMAPRSKPTPARAERVEVSA